MDTETTSEGADDWRLVKEYLQRTPTKWNSLSWIASRFLIASTNDKLAEGAGSLINDLRDHWVGRSEDEVVNCEKVTDFLVAGDPGEQDASQYIVAPALARAAADVGFVVLLSDIIYPSGDVNDYVDGFYRPYRTKADADASDELPLLHIDKPIYAVPGNHDWYDGLYGFAYHFLPSAGDAPTWPDDLVAPRFEEEGQRVRVWESFCRTMWRIPGDPSKAAADARAEAREAGYEQQPASYFVIDTKHVQLVCIDTGIDGKVDSKQMAWLEGLKGSKPKILLTGKPLVVNGRIKKDGDSTANDPVYDVVTDRGRNYIATVGGDVHNFQYYVSSADKLHHFVSGGAGAYTSATHTISIAKVDPRLDPDDRHPDVRTLEEVFPSTAESLSYFAQHLVPGIWRLWRLVTLYGAGVALGYLLLDAQQGSPQAQRWLDAVPQWFPQTQPWISAAQEWLSDAQQWFVEMLSRIQPVGVGGAATALLVALVLIHMIPLSPGSRRNKRHALAALEALVVGVLTTCFLHEQLPSSVEPLLVLYASSVGWLCCNGWVLRRSRWWCPPTTVTMRQHGLFVTGATLLAALALLPEFERWSLDLTTWSVWFLFASVFAYWLALIVGWFFIRRATWWLKHSVWVAAVAQAVVVSAEMWRAMIPEGLKVVYFSGILGIALAVVVALVLVLIPLIADAAAALPGVRSSAERRKRAWRCVSKVTRVVVIVVAAPLVLGLWAWLAHTTDNSYLRAAFGLPTLLMIVAGSTLALDTLRRRWRRRYKVLAALVIVGVGAVSVAATAPGLLARVGSSDSADAAVWWASWWPVVVVVSAAFTVVAVGAAVLSAHLVFLGAYLLVWDFKAHRAPHYDDSTASGAAGPGDFIPQEQSEVILKAEQERFTGRAAGEKSADHAVGRKVKNRARIAFPGLNPPFGPMQRLVSEIYSMDEPPFFKHFLKFATDEKKVTVEIHKIRGGGAVETAEVACFALRPGQPAPPEHAERVDQPTS